MAANAAGELLALHAAGGALPEAYAADFSPERWQSEEYLKLVASGEATKGLQI